MFFFIAALLFFQNPKVTPPASPLQKVPVVVPEDEDETNAELDLCVGPKDAYIVEVTNLLKVTTTFVLGNQNADQKIFVFVF